MRFSILFLFTFLLTHNIYSQDDLPSKSDNYEMSWYIPLSDEDKSQMKKIWKEIGEDLETDKNPLTGTFGERGYQGGYFLRWSVNKGFILIPYYDQNMISDFSYGKVEVTKDNEIILSPEKDLSLNSIIFRSTPRTWIPMKYGEYLVRKEEVNSFGDYFGGFGEFNGFPRKQLCDGCSTFAERMDEKRKDLNVSFFAPKQYINFIKQPINGEIISIGKRWKTKSYESSCCRFETESSALSVSVNVGKKHGVTKNLLFLLIESGDNFSQILKITKVSKNTSEGIIYRTLDENGNETYDGKYDNESDSSPKIPFPPIRIGTKITTSPVETPYFLDK